MPTAIETARQRLHTVLRAAGAASSALPSDIPRNRSLVDVFQDVSAGGVTGKGYVNLIDGDRRIIESFLGADGKGEDELAVAAVIEWIYFEIDEAKRTAGFDAGLDALGAAIEAVEDDPLWDRLDVIGLEEADLSTGPLPGITAARVVLEITLTSRNLFGREKR